MTKSKIIGGKDRCDYRAMTNDELIEEAKQKPAKAKPAPRKPLAKPEIGRAHV